MTFIECVNKVLIRMRENAAGSWTENDYTRLIGRLVNDAKREVEGAHDWTVLKELVSVSIVADDEAVAVTGTNQRTRVFRVWNDTDDCRLTTAPRDRIVDWRQIGTQSTGAPQWWALKGFDSMGLIDLELYPKSDGAYDLIVDCINPQENIETDGTRVTVPGDPVYLRATALALAERGDDQGQTFAQLMNEYQIALNDAITMDTDASHHDDSWIVP